MKANSSGFYGMKTSINGEVSPARFGTASLYLNRELATSPNRERSVVSDAEIFPYSFASDDHLVTAAQTGDQHAFVELCKRHSAAVKKRIFSIVRNQEDADDALQDALLRAYTHLSGFRRSCKFSSWITTIGVNTALMTLRKRRTRQEIQPDHTNAEGETLDTLQYADHSLNPEGLYFKHQIVLVVRREVQKLRPSLRAAIKQYYGSECSLEESAEALGVSVPTAKSRLMRGRKKLRWSLRRRGMFNSGV